MYLFSFTFIEKVMYISYYNFNSPEYINFFVLKFLRVTFNSFSFCTVVMNSGIDVSGLRVSSVFHVKNHSLGF